MYLQEFNNQSGGSDFRVAASDSDDLQFPMDEVLDLRASLERPPSRLVSCPQCGNPTWICSCSSDSLDDEDRDEGEAQQLAALRQLAQVSIWDHVLASMDPSYFCDLDAAAAGSLRVLRNICELRWQGELDSSTVIVIIGRDSDIERCARDVLGDSQVNSYVETQIIDLYPSSEDANKALLVSCFDPSSENLYIRGDLDRRVIGRWWLCPWIIA